MSLLSDDIAIDLGTTNTLVYLKGRGVIIDEPSVVAVSLRRSKRDILAVGAAAVQLMGRTPEALELINPLRDGVIADFVAAGEILRQFIARARTSLCIRPPRVLASIPASATAVEQRAIADAARNAGARKSLLVSEPVAAALGAGLPVSETFASMVVDIGGGTADLAVLRRGAILDARSGRCAGHAMDAAIVRYVRRLHNLAITDEDAENIKIEIGSASTDARKGATYTVRGRDVRTARMKEAVLLSEDIATALDGCVTELTELIQRTLEELPPSARVEIEERKICLAGGGALVRGLADELSQRLRTPVFAARDPLRSVVKGSARVLDDLPAWDHLLIRA